MTTPSFDSLRTTLRGLQRRQSRLVYARLFGFSLAALSGIFLSAVALTAFLALSALAVSAMALAAVLASVLVLRSAWQSARRQRASQYTLALYVEEHLPDLEQRLLTSLEFA